MKVGVFQSACGGMDPQQRIAKLKLALSDHSVDLVVCPELFASGYNIGDDLKRLALPAKGAYFEAIATLAKETGACIAYGYPELGDGCLYNSAACVSPEGNLLANHRKRANSPGSFEEDYFTPGDGSSAFDVKGVNVCLLICYEVEFPETVREAAAQSAQLVIVPTALVAQWDIVANRVVPARAFENGVWVAYANHAGEENGFSYLGGSRIVAPDGREAAVAGADEEFIVADIDVERVKSAQARLPYLRDVGRFRPDCRA
ncbi:MAG: carbon-nitrogen hydrolase family protein [Rhizobiaceae bacterium]